MKRHRHWLWPASSQAQRSLTHLPLAQSLGDRHTLPFGFGPPVVPASVPGPELVVAGTMPQTRHSLSQPAAATAAALA